MQFDFSIDRSSLASSSDQRSTYLTHTRTVRPSEPEVGDRVPGAEQLVTDALHAFEAHDWLRLVELTDRDSIVTLRTQYDFRKNLQDSSLASMESYEPRSEVDQHIADYLASRHKFGELAGITTFEQVHALSDEEFLIRWAQARDHRYLVNGVTPWHEHPSTFPRAVVGSIALTPDTVAVLVRALGTFAPRALDNYSMIPVIGDRSERWHLDAGSGWFGLADAFF